MRGTPEHATISQVTQLALTQEIQAVLTTTGCVSEALHTSAKALQARLSDAFPPDTPVQVGCVYTMSSQAPDDHGEGETWAVRPLTTCADGLDGARLLPAPAAPDLPTASDLLVLDGVEAAWVAPLHAAAAPPALLVLLAPAAAEAAETAMQAAQHLLKTASQTLAAGLRGWTPAKVWDTPQDQTATPADSDLTAFFRTHATLETLASHLPGYVVITDANRMIRYISRMPDGGDPTPLLGKHVLSFSDPELHETITSAYDRAERTLEPSLYSIPHTFPDEDVVRVFHCHVRPIVDAGSVMGFALHNYDASFEIAQSLEHSQLLALVNNARYFIGLGTLDGQITYINPAGMEMVGLPDVEAARQTRALDYVMPEDRDELRRSIMPLVREKGYWRGTYRFRHFPSNTPIPCDVHSFIVHDESGQPTALAMIARDITEQQQVQASLKEERLRLQMAIEGSDLGTWDLDIQGGTIIYNDRWAANLGYTLDEIEPTLDFFRSLTHPDDYVRLAETIQAHLHGNLPQVELEIRIRAKDGSWHWLLNRAHVTEWTPDGTPVRLVGTHLDITERKLGSLALEEERKRLAIAIAGAELGTWVLDLTTGTSTFNERWAEMLGYTLDEIDPTVDFFKSITHPDDLERVFAQLDEHGRGEREMVDLEIRMRHKDGPWRWILDRGKIVERGPDGSPKRIAGTHLDVTDRKRTEEALQASKQRFELATRSTNDGIWEYDFATEQLYWSPRMFTLLGFEPNTFEPSLDVGRELMHPDDVSKHEQHFIAHIQEGKTYGFEYRQRMADGSYRWFYTTGTCQFDADGNPVRMAGSVSDIHDRKQAEIALRESEEQYRLLADHATDVITITQAPDLDTTYVSPSVQQLLGYTPEEYGNLSPHDILTPESLALAFRTNQERLADPRTEAGIDYPNTMILEHIHKDGHHLFTENVVLPFRNDEGEIDGYISNTRDITARKMTEDALQESETRFRTAFESAPIGIALLGANGQLVRVNPAMCDLLGRSEAELFNATYPSLLVEEDRALWDVQLDRLRDGDNPVIQLEQRLMHRDGHPQWVLARATHTRGPATQAAHFVVQVLDISAQKSYEQGLIEAKNRAEEANRLKDTFLANMSHEIRTPLTSILGFTSLLDMQVPDELRMHTAMIQRSGNRLMETLTSMLELAQMQAKSLQLHPTRLDLSAQAHTAADLLGVQAKAKGIDLDVEAPPEPVFVEADENALQRVLANLISNGIKFTEAGQVQVNVRAAKDRATITVCDTGIGISEKFLPYVFDAFKQESNGMGRAYEGTGLGLTISRELVTLMGGTIHVDSAPREGTTFTLHLPLARSATPAAATSQSAPPTLLEPPPPSSLRPTVLVVEDMIDAAIVAERFLRDYYTVYVAHTWDDAMAALEETAFDAFLLDINLKADRDGLELMHALRTHGYADAPMIACTAYALPSDKQRLLDAGFDLHLSKPYTQPQLLQALARALGRTETS